MAVHRIHKTKDYTVISNYHLRDKEMTLKTKGLLSLMLSLPDDWDYSIAGLAAIVKDGTSAIRSGLAELETLGYLKRSPIREDGKIKDWQYDIFEKPQAGFQVVENQQVENRPQLNTKRVNKDESSKDIKKVSKRSFDDILLAYTSDAKTLELLQEWLKVRKAKRAAMTDRAIQLNIDKLDSLAQQSGMPVAEYLKEVICRGWAAFYPIQNYQSKPQQQKPAKGTATDDFMAQLQAMYDND